MVEHNEFTDYRRKKACDNLAKLASQVSRTSQTMQSGTTIYIDVIYDNIERGFEDILTHWEKLTHLDSLSIMHHDTSGASIQ